MKKRYALAVGVGVSILLSSGCGGKGVSGADRSKIEKVVLAWFEEFYKRNDFKPVVECKDFVAQGKDKVLVKVSFSVPEMTGVKRALTCTVERRADAWEVAIPPDL